CRTTRQRVGRVAGPPDLLARLVDVALARRSDQPEALATHLLALRAQRAMAQGTEEGWTQHRVWAERRLDPIIQVPREASSGRGVARGSSAPPASRRRRSRTTPNRAVRRRAPACACERCPRTRPEGPRAPGATARSSRRS